ncbi:hypothetical protein PHLGIDRAFT_38293 [Phlebiopsis gigantea 11061_1 CR5-6]|uniref:Uncharacterized protein n=1 Tax=Phlebiopsis gigantea (strain 11061_1 CR5-6) TaxID=745531 RepID=A0A0C3RPL3_PHLG1|nr:hypothetical protein PHLGIDRAFT_38293 [Phlebiopsis gigantea 11061_1 CR5-6]
MASSSRDSYPSITFQDRVPSWLVDSPFDFNDVHKPPSYLLASLQQAYDDYELHNDPPTYEHSVATAGTSSRAPSPRRISLAGESVWEDDDEEEDEDEETEGYSGDADDEEDDAADSELDARSGGGKSRPTSSGQSTVSLPLRDDPPAPSTPISTPTPQEDDSRIYRSRPLPPIPHIPAVAHHLLHLQHLVNTADADPYSDLAICLSSLDPQLLLNPFAVFVDLCYEDAVRGDTSDPVLRPFSPPPALSTSHSSTLTDDSEEDEILASPTQAPTGATSPAETVVAPLVWDPRTEERVRGLGGVRLPLHYARPTSPFAPADDDLPASPKQHIRFHAPDPLSEVASLFLHTPAPDKAQVSVAGFPTRARAPPARSTLSLGSMRGMLLRSLNIS